MIRVENLCKSFGRNRAVNNVSFRISSGEVVGFLGPNGAGKTTTMRVITTYLAADSGRVTIAGADVNEDPLGVRQSIGYLPESAPLYLDMEVLEYLGHVAAIRRIRKSSRRARIKEIVLACGLRDVLQRKVGYLSKGYRQRVGLAQAMIHDPAILVLDEPTTGLDPNQIIEIRELIKTVGLEKTVILSTHILSEVQTTCSRILIIDKGRIVADGKPEELAGAMKGGITYRVSIKGDKNAVEKNLEAAPFIEGFRNVSRGGTEINGGLDYIVWGTQTEERSRDMGEKLFRLAVDKNFVLTEIAREVASLENVFASLTVGEDET